jgi:hypothetical protein
MMAQISQAINSGKSAATMDTVQSIAVIATLGAIVLDMAQCFGVDVVSEIKDWITKRYIAAKSKFSGGPPDKNSKVGKFLAGVRKVYQTIMGWVDNVRGWIQSAIDWVNKGIAWVDGRIATIMNAISTPCARQAISNMPPETQSMVQSVPARI